MPRPWRLNLGKGGGGVGSIGDFEGWPAEVNNALTLEWAVWGGWCVVVVARPSEPMINEARRA